MAPSDRTAKNRGLTSASRSSLGNDSGPRRRGIAELLLALISAGASAGCGPTLYVVDLLEAERQLEEARVENARFHAPYEYHAADAYLEKAREEAAEGQYEDAIRFAQSAAHLSHRALQISQASKGAR